LSRSLPAGGAKKAEAEAAPVKRGRGRPRKEPKPEPEEEDGEDEQEDAAPPPAKRVSGPFFLLFTYFVVSVNGLHKLCELLGRRCSILSG
jgi:hypothetical protein